MKRTLLLTGSATIDATPASRRWVRERLAAELLSMSSSDRIIATAPLDFLRFSLGQMAPAFVYLHASGAVLVDGRDCGGRWDGDAMDVLRAYRDHEPTAETLVFMRTSDGAQPDATGLDALVLICPEPS